uniref:RNA-directed RNA polymerase n=1 Tax=Hubei reo-like virus 10 TaxID=1923173 RepID=A0A1L3KP88_9VIRU|nr:RNA-dependent RNA polymerase [Hubei reo-like virus 10]
MDSNERLRFMLDELRLRLSFSNIKTIDAFKEFLKCELNFSEFIIKLRNEVGTNVKIDSYDANGLLFGGSTSVIINEEKFHNVWYNAINLIDDSKANYVDILARLILSFHNDIMWYKLTDADVMSSILPSFRLCDFDYHVNRNANLLKRQPGAVSKFGEDIFQSVFLEDRDITLRNDLNKFGFSKIKLSKYLSFRIKNELDPHYLTHPSELFLCTVSSYYLLYGNKYNIVISYVKKLLLELSDDNSPFLHFPAQFSSDGNFVNLQYHSGILLCFRYCMNLLGMHIINSDIFRYDILEYQEVYEEIFIFIISDVHYNGSKLKKILRAAYHYMGHDRNRDVSYEHLHPKYSFHNYADSMLSSKYHFTSCGDCNSCNLERESSEYNRDVRIDVESMYSDLDKLHLYKLKKFLKYRIMSRNCNIRLIEDITFIKCFIAAGGYAHSHQLTDFDNSLVSNLEKLKSFNSDGEADWLVSAMYRKGYDMTILTFNQYPTGVQFKSNIERSLTSRSAGIGSFNAKFSYNDPSVNELQKHIQLTGTAKLAYSLFQGGKIFDLSNEIINPLNIHEVTPSNWYNDKGDILPEKLNSALRMSGISNIGSRSTTNFRAVRPIYINPLMVHLAMEAVIGPHIKATNHILNQNPTTAYISEKSTGSCIATLHIDGTSDFIAPAIMATSDDESLIASIDSSNWDQHFPSLLINEYYKGIIHALEFLGADSMEDNSNYMYLNGIGMNLRQLAEWLIKYQTERKYMASYGIQKHIYNVPFMTSGRLDTFYLNSVLNECIVEHLGVKVANLFKNKVVLSWSQVAGDDAIIVFNTYRHLASDEIANLKQVIVDVYTSAGQETNISKTLLSYRAFEYSKQNAFCGMVFRDPTIQLFESEKDSRTDDRIEKMKGYSMKIFDSIRRSSGIASVQCFFGRLILAVSHHLTIMSRNSRRDLNRDMRLASSLVSKIKNDNKGKMIKELPGTFTNLTNKYKYYYPFQSVIIPTAFSAGLGFSLTSLSMNEVIFINCNLQDFVRTALPVTEAVNFEYSNDAADALFKYLIEKVKDKRTFDVDVNSICSSLNISNSKSIVKNFSLSILNTDSGIDDVVGSLISRVSNINYNRLISAERAVMKIQKSYNIKLNKKYFYSYLPFKSYLDSLRTVIKNGAIYKDASDRKLKHIFKMNLNDSNDKVEIDHSRLPRIDSIMIKYKLMDGFRLIFNVNDFISDNELQSKSIRYATCNAVTKKLQLSYGTRNGLQPFVNFKGMPFLIMKFLSRTGLTITSTELVEILISSGCLSGGVELIKNVLISISGDESASETLSNDLFSQLNSWADESIAANIVGSSYELIDLRTSIILPHISLSGINLNSNHKNIILYLSYMYMLQCSAILDRNLRSAVVENTGKLHKIWNNVDFIGPDDGFLKEIRDILSQFMDDSTAHRTYNYYIKRGAFADECN